MRYAPGVAVSDAEREHLRLIGELKARAHAEALAEHLALPLDARLARSVALMRRFLATTPPRADDPSPFYDRARRQGLYRP